MAPIVQELNETDVAESITETLIETDTTNMESSHNAASIGEEGMSMVTGVNVTNDSVADDIK